MIYAYYSSIVGSFEDFNEKVQEYVGAKGIQIDENQVTLSTDAAIDALKQKGYRKGFIIGTKSMIKYLKDFHIKVIIFRQIK